MMPARTFDSVRDNPLAGDVVELLELEEDAEHYETMLRVICVAEEWVWFKEYGKPGRHTLHMQLWKERLAEAQCGKVIPPAGL